MNQSYSKTNFRVLTLIFTLFLFECKDQGSSNEIATIATGRSMDPETPTMALEILLESNRFFLFTSVPIYDTCHYYTGSLNQNETEQIVRYIAKSVISLDTSRQDEIDDATSIELYYMGADGIPKHGFGYYSDELKQDSISTIMKLAQNASNFKCTTFYKFKTIIQNETLPPPPSLP